MSRPVNKMDGAKRVLALLLAGLGCAWALPCPAGAQGYPDSDSLTITIQPRDIWPPAAVADLQALPGSEGQALLQWTAPEEDTVITPSGDPVSLYIMKLATFSVQSAGSTTTWWSTAQNVLGEPFPPLSPGAPQSMLFNNLEPGVTFYFALKSEDEAGNPSAIDTNADTPGLQAEALIYDAVPSSPTNVTATVVSSTEVFLEWNAVSAFDLDFYRIYVDSIAPYDFVGDFYTQEVDSDTISYTHSDLTTGSSYYYYVTAVDKGPPGYALESSSSNVVFAIPGISPPTGLSGAALGVSSISWTWNGVAGADSYELRLATDGVTVVGSTDSTNFTETGLSTNAAYGRVAVAVKGAYYSALSLSATTYTSAAGPLGLIVTSVSSETVNLAWNARGNPPITPYEVSMSLDDFVTDFSTPIAFSDNLTSTYTAVPGLLPATTYSFRVRARNGGGFETEFSNVVSTTTSEVDYRIPLTPVVTPDGPFTYRKTYMHFVWEGGMPTSSGTVVDARYAVGTSSGAADVVGWKSILPEKTDVITRFHLTEGATYYISMKTLSSYGVWSDTGVSFGVRPDYVVPAISDMWAIEALSYVSLDWDKADVGISGVKGYVVEYRRGEKPVWRNAKTGEVSPLSLAPQEAGKAVLAGVKPLGFSPAELVTGEHYAMFDLPHGTYFFRVWAVNGAERVSDEPAYSNRLVVGRLPYDVISGVASYPNPFDSRRQSTVINYTMNQDAPVKIEIFDLSGGLVKKFEFGAGQAGGQAGTNDVIWDGTDRKGRKVSMGMYLAVIQSGSSRVVWKIGVIH